jgi:GntR family transcriptional repressor for pyruvate dehydrogenase complex
MDSINYTVNKINLYEQIADTLEKAITKSGLKAAKLPSEHELSKRFNVSRTVIREALKALKERGLIQSRNGEGSFVSKPSVDAVSNVVNRIIQIDNISNDTLHGMRIILEVAASRLAALHALDGEIEYLEETIRRITSASSEDERIRADADFHIIIAKASRNDLLGMFVEVMTILLRDYMIKGMPSPAALRKTLHEHNKILEALRLKDPDMAEEAMRTHLIAARDNVNKFEKKQLKSRKTSAKRVK